MPFDSRCLHSLGYESELSVKFDLPTELVTFDLPENCLLRRRLGEVLNQLHFGGTPLTWGQTRLGFRLLPLAVFKLGIVRKQGGSFNFLLGRRCSLYTIFFFRGPLPETVTEFEPPFYFFEPLSGLLELTWLILCHFPTKAGLIFCLNRASLTVNLPITFPLFRIHLFCPLILVLVIDDANGVVIVWIPHFCIGSPFVGFSVGITPE